MSDLIQFAADGGGIMRGHGVAYTGGVLSLWGIRYVVDLEDLEAAPQVPLLRDHVNATTHRLGIVTPTIANGQLNISATIESKGFATQDVVDQTSPWQLSVGVMVKSRRELEADATATVNGREVTGPAMIVGGVLQEVSVVAIGADNATSFRIAASADGGEYLYCSCPISLTADPKPQTEGTQMPDQNNTPAPDAGALEAAAKAERERITAIMAVPGITADVQAKAVADGWDAGRAALAVLQAKQAAEAEAEKAAGVQIIVAQNTKPKANVLEAVMSARYGMAEDKRINAYGEQTVEAADKLRGLSLWETMRMAARNEGVEVGPVPNSDNLRAAFTVTSLPGILGSSAKKALQGVYQAAPSVANRVCYVHDTNDFKQFTIYRFSGAGALLEVGPGGEIKSQELSEESSTNQVKTRAKMVVLTRQDIINDDLGAIQQIVTGFGQQASRAVDKLFAETVLGNAGTFFGSGNGNYISGASTALSHASLGTAIQKMAEQTDMNGEPINLSPRYIVYPAGLDETARNLVRSGTVVLTGSTDLVKGDRNVWADYGIEPVKFPHLGLSTFTGYSATAWYLVADPMQCPAFDLAYLAQSGRGPVIEFAQTDFATLGMQWRCYMDFGIALNDYRGAVKSAGA